MLATKFIIALCPATPIYLAAPSRAPKGAITRVKDDACRFDTFEAAMEVAKDITGWGGAQRVEQVAVEVEDTRSTIATDDDLYEIRDAATAAFTEAEGDAYSRACAVEGAMRDLGLKCRTNGNQSASSSVSVYLADHLGNTAQFDWDPMQDGFDITEATCLADDGIGGGDTLPCDGCEATDAEPCGDSEGFAFCAACRAKSQDAPKAAHAVDFDPAFLDAVLGRDDLTFDQTPLTAEQAKHARAALTAALRSLVYANIHHLASSALTEARDNT